MREKEDKRIMEEYTKHPITNFADSINRSMIGEPGQLIRGIITTGCRLCMPFSSSISLCSWRLASPR